MDQSEAIKIVEAWGVKNGVVGMLEIVEAMRDGIYVHSDTITLRDKRAYDIFCAGMRELFFGKQEEEA